MGSLTVRETLLFTADLCLPETLPLPFKRQRVEDVMNDLRITHVADSKIGMAGKRWRATDRRFSLGGCCV
jgi:ABC-type multidrug transport system ATPase subunit